MTDAPDDFDLDQFLPYQLSVAAGRVSRDFGARYRARFGLSIPEWRILAHLSQTDSLSIRDIHLRADLEKSKASRAAGRLEAAGLVEKRAGEGDKRLIALTLTERGREVMEELIPLARAFEAEIVELLPADERAALARLMARLMNGR